MKPSPTTVAEGLRAGRAPRGEAAGPRDEWDAFLAASPCGHFQQTSAWADGKAGQGWKSSLHLIRDANDEDSGRIVGGFQLLHKTRRGVPIGYVSKGPVLDPAHADRWPLALRRLEHAVASERLAAAVVQPPDDAGREMVAAMRAVPFFPAPFLGVIDATLLIDLTGGEDAVFRRFRPSTRNKFRKALRGGLTVREGDEADLPVFFALMEATCRRQRVAPNPPSLEAMQTLWRTLSVRGTPRLFLADDRGEAVAGILTIGFGDRMSIFKTGWDGARRESHPNNLVVCEALKWACARGFRVADFVGLDRSLADTILAGGTITPDQNQSRDAFKLGFGGRPVLLPEARLLVPNAVLRTGLRLATSLIGTVRRPKAPPRPRVPASLSTTP